MIGYAAVVVGTGTVSYLMELYRTVPVTVVNKPPPPEV